MEDSKNGIKKKNTLSLDEEVKDDRTNNQAQQQMVGKHGSLIVKRRRR